VRGCYSYLCDINLMDSIKIFPFKNRRILIFRPNLYTCEEPAPQLLCGRSLTAGITSSGDE